MHNCLSSTHFEFIKEMRVWIRSKSVMEMCIIVRVVRISNLLKRCECGYEIKKSNRTLLQTPVAVSSSTQPPPPPPPPGGGWAIALTIITLNNKSKGDISSYSSDCHPLLQYFLSQHCLSKSSQDLHPRRGSRTSSISKLWIVYSHHAFFIF